MKGGLGIQSQKEVSLRGALVDHRAHLARAARASAGPDPRSSLGVGHPKCAYGIEAPLLQVQTFIRSIPPASQGESYRIFADRRRVSSPQRRLPETRYVWRILLKAADLRLASLEAGRASARHCCAELPACTQRTSS